MTRSSFKKTKAMEILSVSMIFPTMIKDLVKYRNKSERFRRRKVGPWFRTIDRESSVRGSNSARFMSELIQVT